MLGLVLFWLAGTTPANRGDEALRVEPLRVPKGGFSSFCFECKAYFPLNGRHCYACRECIAGFDHHCDFLDNCVGKGNQRLFVWLVAVWLIIGISTFFLSILALIGSLRFDEEMDVLYHLLGFHRGAYERMNWWISMGLCVGSGVFSGNMVFLCYYTLAALWTGVTSYERFRKKSRQSDLQQSLSSLSEDN